MELAGCFQFRGALRTSPQMLFYFKTSVIFELVINVEHNVVFYPITFHFRTPLGFELRATSFEPTGLLAARSPRHSKTPHLGLISSHLRKRAAQFLRGAE